MTSPTAVLAIDQGTTNSKALLVASDGRVLANGSCSLPMSNPRPGWFEQDAGNLWNSVVSAVNACLAKAPEVEVVGLGLSNQRESVVAWDSQDGRPLSMVLGWQDGRTEKFCRSLGPDVAELVHRSTGLRLDPMFSAPKLRYLLDQLGSLDPATRVSTIDAYVLRRLTGAEAGCEAGNASRTLLFDLRRRDWGEDLLNAFGVPLTALPRVRASSADFGRTVAVGALPAGIPVLAVLGDSHAALFGHDATQAGSGKVTYGTGSSVMIPIEAVGAAADLPWTVSTTLAWLADNAQYAREGNIVATGSGLDALAGLLGFEDVGALIREAEQADGPHLSYVPAFSGLGAPHWDRAAVGLLVGLGREANRAQVARAGLDAIAQQICDVVEAMESAGDVVGELWADGGSSASPFLMQLQADLLGKPIKLAAQAEASALGAAWLAWQTLGEPVWNDPHKVSSFRCGTLRGPQGNPTQSSEQASRVIYQPQRDQRWRQNERARWADAISRSRLTH